MASKYITRLAEQALKEIATEEEWKRFLPKKPDNITELEPQLESDALLQAKIAWHIGYTPSKWLLEDELEEINSRRDKFAIPWLDAKGNWQGPEAEKIGEWEKKEVAEWEKKTGAKAAAKSDDAHHRAARSGLMGLCFSGGGIRSATFNLGILQGLAELDLLKCFDYLASVSGGGYIHQFLAAWSSRKTFPVVTKELIPLPEEGSPPSHPEPIRWLRRYSNYLTPEKGLLSLDTWVIAAIWLRNTLLNLIILISSLLFVMLLPHLFALNWFVPSRHWAVAATLAAIVYLFLIAVALLRRELSLLSDPDILVASSVAQPISAKELFMGQSGVQRWLVLPVLLASLLITLLFPIGALGINFIWAWVLVPILYFVLNLTITFAGGTLTAYLKTHHFIGPKEKAKDFWPRTKWSCPAYLRARSVQILLVVAALIVAFGGAGWHLLMRLMTIGLPSSLGVHLWRLELVIAPPLLMMGPLLTGILLIGLIGRIFKDSRREWLARLGAMIGLYAVVWIFFVGGSLFGAVILKWLACKIWAGIPAFVTWAATSVWSVLAGNSSKTAGAKDDKAPSKFNLLEIVAKVGPYVFVAGLLILLSALAEVIIRGHGAWYFLTALAAAAVICLVFAWRVDINEFSMHAYYRDRLARCYLGASNCNRKPNPFTGFDDEDSDVPVSSLSASKGYFGPYPIFCTTLNLTFGEDLAWQERKGASFMFGPRLSGYDVGWTEAKGRRNDLRFNGFVETATYAYPDPGIHISTAVAISGAALSPNWGYHTNSATAFLLTVFNVRLGWWLRNPRTVAQDGKRISAATKAGFLHDQYPWPSPRFSLLALTNELFGHTNDTSKYLYLTDGGHFDNMGLYELVRRRCRYIVICDAEEDGQLRFEGIGMAIRKCRIDFGAEVSLDLRPLQHPEGENSSTHCVVGTITYQEDALSGVSGVKPGIVVYIKSSLTGDEPADVLNYKREDPCFPHDSTLNQWFTESQFESYRRLGHHVAMVTFAAASPDERCCCDQEQRVDYFQNLTKIWSAFTPEMQQYSAAHSRSYGKLLQNIRRDENLPGLFDMLLDRYTKDQTWMEPSGENKKQPTKSLAHSSREHAVQVTSQLIEFMFIVYLQLKLVYPENLRHPFAQGWLDIFKSWAHIDVVKEGWEKYGQAYTGAFQIFVEKHIGLPLPRKPRTVDDNP
jgi:hypothetical protein